MEKKFKKDWSKLPMLYGFGVIFYPRLKLEGLESGLDNIGEFLAINTTDQFPIIKEKIFSLYISYESRFRNTSRVKRPQQRDDNPHSFLNVFGLSKKKKKTTTQGEESGNGSSSRGGGNNGGFNELMVYLSEGLVVNSSEMFDLVQWWRARALTWPILTRLAMDIFSIPVSTVTAEQAVSTTSRIFEEWRNALQLDIVEALVCIKD
ncbi:Putative AC transposase [Morus notabilis]|uniref:Putative AC transposase n=1 Tax=Morus notabilis TaxID=981085 RepID=W9RXN4_9ROSA|nr:Putative AC transposase [Morus notabilis]